MLFHYAECRNADCRYTECHLAQPCLAESPYAWSHYPERRYTECRRGALDVYLSLSIFISNQNCFLSKFFIF